MRSASSSCDGDTFHFMMASLLHVSNRGHGCVMSHFENSGRRFKRAHFRLHLALQFKKLHAVSQESRRVQLISGNQIADCGTDAGRNNIADASCNPAKDLPESAALLIWRLLSETKNVVNAVVGSICCRK